MHNIDMGLEYEQMDYFSYDGSCEGNRAQTNTVFNNLDPNAGEACSRANAGSNQEVTGSVSIGLDVWSPIIYEHFQEGDYMQSMYT